MALISANFLEEQSLLGSPHDPLLTPMFAIYCIWESKILSSEEKNIITTYIVHSIATAPDNGLGQWCPNCGPWFPKELQNLTHLPI